MRDVLDVSIFIDVMLDQPISHLVYRQGIYLKNSVDWEPVGEDVKGLNWNGINRSPCLESSLNEALLHIIIDRVSKRTILVRIQEKPWFDDRCLS